MCVSLVILDVALSTSRSSVHYSGCHCGQPRNWHVAPGARASRCRQQCTLQTVSVTVRGPPDAASSVHCRRFPSRCKGKPTADGFGQGAGASRCRQQCTQQTVLVRVRGPPGPVSSVHRRRFWSGCESLPVPSAVHTADGIAQSCGSDLLQAFSRDRRRPCLLGRLDGRTFAENVSWVPSDRRFPCLFVFETIQEPLSGLWS